MLSARPRRLMTASLVLVAGLSLSACGTGVDAQTNAVYQPAIGANLRSGDVQLYNTLLVANENGTYTLSAGLLNKTDQAQELTGASVAPLGGGAPATAKTEGTVELQSERLLTIGPKGEIVLKSDDLVPGKYATVTLTFTGGDVSIEAPVVARGEEGVYTDVAESAGGAESESADVTEPNEVAAEGAEGSDDSE